VRNFQDFFTADLTIIAAIRTSCSLTGCRFQDVDHAGAPRFVAPLHSGWIARHDWVFSRLL